MNAKSRLLVLGILSGALLVVDSGCSGTDHGTSTVVSVPGAVRVAQPRAGVTQITIVSTASDLAVTGFDDNGTEIAKMTLHQGTVNIADAADEPEMGLGREILVSHPASNGHGHLVRVGTEPTTVPPEMPHPELEKFMQIPEVTAPLAKFNLTIDVPRLRPAGSTYSGRAGDHVDIRDVTPAGLTIYWDNNCMTYTNSGSNYLDMLGCYYTYPGGTLTEHLQQKLWRGGAPCTGGNVRGCGYEDYWDFQVDNGTCHVYYPTGSEGCVYVYNSGGFTYGTTYSGFPTSNPPDGYFTSFNSNSTGSSTYSGDGSGHNCYNSSNQVVNCPTWNAGGACDCTCNGNNLSNGYVNCTNSPAGYRYAPSN